MHVRSISPAEVDAFAAIGPHSLGVDGFAQYIRELWQLGASQPSRCFVIEEGTHILGRIVYRGSGDDVNFTGLHLPSGEAFFSVGQCLFQESLSELYLEGVRYLEAFLSSASAQTEQVRELLQKLGLPLTQTKFRYIWQGDSTSLIPSSRLIYRTRNQVSDADFIDLIRRASIGTLDALDQLQIKQLGENTHARTYFEVLKTEFEDHPDWWLAAYTPDQQPVGHIVGVPYNLHRHESAIGYIGVIPEQRGHGYSDDLLRDGMRAMTAAGITTVIADTDEVNRPMQAALERCGYQRSDTTWVYRQALTAILK